MQSCNAKWTEGDRRRGGGSLNRAVSLLRGVVIDPPQSLRLRRWTEDLGSGHGFSSDHDVPTTWHSEFEIRAALCRSPQSYGSLIPLFGVYFISLGSCRVS